MGSDSKKAPPPAPSDLSSSTGVDVPADMAATDLSKVTERTDRTGGTIKTDRTDRTDKSSYSIPEDGTPVTIPTNRRRKDGDSSLSRDTHQSQTSLLIEYFEGGKGSDTQTRRPSVRVKVTPSSKSRSKSSGGHIQISKTRHGDGERSSRRATSSSYSKRDSKRDRIDDLDGQSVSSYASRTEESNVSRNPIDIEVRPPRRHGSPLIPNADAPGRETIMSDVSSMPANSFLDGESSINSREKSKSRGYSRGDALIQGAASGAARAIVSDALKPQRRRSRSLSRERRKSEKSGSDKKRTSKSEHRSKTDDRIRDRSVSDSKKRSTSSKNDDKYYISERKSSPRRSSRSRYKEESLVSGVSGVSGVSAADSSVLSSKVSDRTYRSGTSVNSKSSIGNPKLLEAVEDAIRRLILPELNAMRADSVRREKKDKERAGTSRSRRSSLTSATNSALSTESRDVDSRSKRTSGGDYSIKSKTTTTDDRPRSVSSGKIKLQKRDVDRAHSESPRTPIAKTPGTFDRTYSEDSVRESGSRKTSGEKEKRSTLGAIGAAIGLGSVAYATSKEHSISKESQELLEQKEKEDRRRRRARSRSRSDGGSLAESYESHLEEETTKLPRMPMMSEINASDITRSSILSADTDRPRTSGGESTRTPIKEVSRGFGSTESSQSITPTKSPYHSTRNLGTYHANVSTPNLSQTNLQRHQQEFELNEQGQKVPMNRDREIEEHRYETEYYGNQQEDTKGKSIVNKLAGAAATVLAKTGITHQGSHDPYEQESDEEDEYTNSYNTQHVPAPLKYVPYNQEKRGLSPIQSVSGYTEADEQERLQKHRDSRASYGMQSKGSYSTISNSPQKHQKQDSYDSQTSDTRNYDFKEVRQGGLTDSEISNDPDQQYLEEQHRINERYRDMDALSYQSSDPRMDKHRSGFTEESNWQENSDLSDKQNYGGVGGKLGYIQAPHGAESQVASLLDASVLTANTASTRSPKPVPVLSPGGLSPGGLSPRGMTRSPALRAAHSYDSRLSEQSGGLKNVGRRVASNASYDENSEANFTVATPNPELQAETSSRRDFSWASERELPVAGHSSEESYEEYDLDSQGHKINMPVYQQVTGAAGGASKQRIAENNERNLSTQSPVSTPGGEYELDQYGRKAEMPNQNGTVSTKDAVLASVVAGAAGAAAGGIIANRYQVPESQKRDDYFGGERYSEEAHHIPGAPLQKSFKDRAVDYNPPSPRYSEDRFTEDNESLKLTANALPDAQSPMPEFANDGSVTTNPQSINGDGEYRHYSDEMEWQHDDRSRTPTQGGRTPTPGTPTRNTPIIGGGTPMSINRKPIGTNSNLSSPQSDTALKAGQMGLMDGFVPTAKVGPNPAGPFKGHKREGSFDQNDQEWERTSVDRKRDTLVTNPYENSSPVTLLGGERDRQVLGQLGYDGVKQNVGGALNYGVTSPGGYQKDEGYVSAQTRGSAGGITPEPRQRGVGFTDAVGMGPGEFDQDSFQFTPKHQRHASGMSQGMESPLYDSSMGTHRDAIKSKDIVALMDHLTVRDAQRNARDTEILVTLVRAAAEMRTSFEDMKRLLADTEDQVITEVQRNTDKSVAKASMGLARPLPQSVKSLRSGDDDDVPSQRRNVFRRALKGLKSKSGKELAQIEGMLVQLLGDVEGLKVAQGLGGGGMNSAHYDDYDSRSLEPIGDNHQGDGYEPDGHAGTTTASHASQSGHFSIPRATNANGSADKFGGRKFSENRISTVPEGDEDDELDERERKVLDSAYHEDDRLTPIQRAESMPLESPPFIKPDLQSRQTFAASNDNTPKADKSKKHKATKSFTWNPLPKISRWSETTASTVADKFRSGKVNDSRNNSDMNIGRDSFDYDPRGEDKLGYNSQEHFNSAAGPILTGGPARLDPAIQENRNFDGGAYSPVSFDEDRPRTAPSEVGGQASLPSYPQMKVEDPKYKAHRNSLNLQHPQPRPGQQYQSQLEREAIDYNGAKSPASMNWNSSQVSLPPNQNYRRLSAGTTGTDGSNLDGTYDNDNQQQGGLAPARPPKEPLDNCYGSGSATPAQRTPVKLPKPSPLVQNQTQNYDTWSDEEDDATVSYDGSPRVANRQQPAYMSGGNNAQQSNMSGPSRKPTGPRQMGAPTRPNASAKSQGELLKQEMERKRGKAPQSPAMSEGSEGAGKQYQYW